MVEYMLKSWLLLILLPWPLCMVAGDNLSSDNYRPFAQTGKTWETRVGWTEENVYCNRIDGDTLINGESWKKVYNFYAFPELNYSYYAAIRDVGKKVYAIAKGSSRPRLLYDFGLKVGDIVRCGVEGTAFGCLLDEGEQLDSLLGFRLFYYLRLERIDTVESCGLKHPRFTLTMLDPFKDKLMMADDIVWVEGIGSGAGPFSPWMPLPPIETVFQQCLINKTYIFTYPDFYQDHESANVSAVRTKTSNNKNVIDLHGHRLTGKPSKGVYIEDGRKMVGK